MCSTNLLYTRDEDPLALFLGFPAQLVGTLRSRLDALRTRVNTITLGLPDKESQQQVHHAGPLRVKSLLCHQLIVEDTPFAYGNDHTTVMISIQTPRDWI